MAQISWGKPPYHSRIVDDKQVRWIDFVCVCVSAANVICVRLCGRGSKYKRYNAGPPHSHVWLINTTQLIKSIEINSDWMNHGRSRGTRLFFAHQLCMIRQRFQIIAAIIRVASALAPQTPVCRITAIIYAKLMTAASERASAPLTFDKQEEKFSRWRCSRNGCVSFTCHFCLIRARTHTHTQTRSYECPIERKLDRIYSMVTYFIDGLNGWIWNENHSQITVSRLP